MGVTVEYSLPLFSVNVQKGQGSSEWRLRWDERGNEGRPNNDVTGTCTGRGGGFGDGSDLVVRRGTVFKTGGKVQEELRCD